MLNFAICDDNFLIRNKLEKMLESIFITHLIEAKIVLNTENPKTILKFNDCTINVYILDIELNSNFTGIDLAKNIRSKDKSSYIIFLTGHIEYSMLAYKVKTFDYLIKPITYEKLESTILRLEDDLQHPSADYIPIGKKLINKNNITFIEKNKMKAIIHTDTNKVEVYNSLDKLEYMLPTNFLRCHKSYIINTDKISNIDINKNTICFLNNSECVIGPKYKEKLMEEIINEPI